MKVSPLVCVFVCLHAHACVPALLCLSVYVHVRVFGESMLVCVFYTSSSFKFFNIKTDLNNNETCVCGDLY